jgi:hypothetical protein
LQIAFLRNDWDRARATVLSIGLCIVGCGGHTDPNGTGVGGAGAGGSGGSDAAGVGGDGTGGCGVACFDASDDVSAEADAGTSDAPGLADARDTGDGGDVGDAKGEADDDAGDEADAREPRDSSEAGESGEVADAAHDGAEGGDATDGGTDATAGDASDGASSLASGPPYWLPGVPMTAGRYNFAASLVMTGLKKGKIVAVNGSSDAPATYETFDTLGTSWTSDSTPEEVSENTATTGTDGKVYVFGHFATKSWVFDGTWSSFAPPPHGGFPSAAAGSDGLIYVGSTQNVTTNIDVYSPLLGQWSPLAKPKPHAAYGEPLLVSLGSKIYVLGGDSLRPRAFEAYDVVTGTWSSLADSPMPPSGPALAVGGDGRIYATGGQPGTMVVKTVIAYDPVTDHWDSVAPLSNARVQHAAVPGPDGRIYVLGGSDAGNSKSVEVYGPVGALTTALSVPGTVTQSAPPGTVVLLTGNNFAANANVAVYFGAVQGSPLAKGKTNGTGGLAPSIAFKVPDLPAGDTFVSVIDDRSRFPIAIPFTVTASARP